MRGAGGGKRSGRKPARVETDDSPRGYEATRMRQLWRDIDDARHKAGLGRVPEPEAAPIGWSASALFECTAALVGDAAAWVQAHAQAACALIAGGAEVLRSVPVVGRLAALVPASEAPPPGSERPPGRANGVGRPVAAEAGEPTGPDGGWIH
ncbi:MAG: hypothetical protein B6D46_13390 [Polyangiaceae bacterium UTPRO1]|nr:hypothetical protein [Myxococcales bacterium]OQY65692.1 MAG: hypothetical protein B6D46_13390 [Polyangiaceae bacterium UTPRO1]